MKKFLSDAISKRFKGLRAVFGENFDTLLDQVYKDHFEEVAELGKRYHRDTETIENQRYLTEEFLADCADAKTKPSWWKEFLGFIRQQLRKILPKMHFTDRDIEYALSRSARAMRKRSKKAASAFSEEDIADIRFMLDENLPGVSEEKIADYQSSFGNIINTDSAKLLFRNEGYDPHDIESVKKFHPQAGAIARRLFDKFLQERKGKGNGNVVFTGGGTGSGKSSIMDDLAVKNADFVFDSTMVNYEAARQSIQKVIDNGQIPLLAFVYRDPADAWFNGVQKRNKNADGHIVPETVFANTHTLARETFLHLVDEFGKKVEYIIKEIESGKDASEISIEELKNKPKYTKEQIKEALYAGTYTGAKRFLEQIRRTRETNTTTDTGLAETISFQKTDDTGLHAVGRLDDGRRDRRIRESSSGDIGVNEDSGIRFSVGEVWTGSAADYDKPSLQYVGTGEGQQVYGWGLYGSSSREVAEWYANEDAKRKAPTDKIEIKGEIYTPFTHIDDPILQRLVKTVFRYDIGNLKQLTKVLSQEFQDASAQKDKASNDDDKEHYQKTCDEISETIALAYRSNLKFNLALQGNRHIYRQTFWDGRVENLLDWDEEVPITLLLNLKNHLIDGYENGTLGNGIGEDVQYKTVMLMYNSMSGGELYNILSKGLGSPKAASEFLYSAGIDGITYVGDSSGERNYVAFSDKDIRVDEHIRFSLAEYSEADQRDIVKILKPFTGKYAILKDLKEHGVDIPAKDAARFAVEAAREVMKDAIARSRQRAMEFFRQANPLFDYFMEFSDKQLLNPGRDHAGEDFTGTFISEAYRKYSVKEPQGKRTAITLMLFGLIFE